MRKWIFLTIVAAATLGALLAVRNLETYLERNHAWLAERAQQALGRRVEFEGLGVSFKGGLGVRVRKLRVADDPAFSYGDVVSADAALIRVRLLPALRGRFEVSRVALEKPVLHVIKTADGLNVTRTPGAAQRGGTGTPRVDSSAAFGAAGIVVAYLDIAGGTIEYVDTTATPPLRLVLEQIDVSASEVRGDVPVSFELAAAVFGAHKQNVHARGSFGPLSARDLGAAPVALELRASPLALDELTRIPRLRALLPTGVAGEGPASLTASASGSGTTVNVVATLDATKATVGYGSMLRKPRGMPLSTTFEARLGREGVELDRAQLSMEGTELTATSVTRTSAPATRVAATSVAAPSVGTSAGTTAVPATPGERTGIAIQSGSIELARLPALAPALAGWSIEGTLQLDLRIQPASEAQPAIVNGNVAVQNLGVRSGDTQLVAGLSTIAVLTGRSASIAPATFRLGGTPAGVRADVESFDKPVLRFVLTSTELPLDALASTAAASEATGVLRDLTVDAVMGLTADARKPRVTAKSAAGVFGDTAYEHLAVTARLDAGRAIFDTVSAQVFGGTLTAEGVYDFRASAEPAFNFESHLRGVRLHELTAALGARSRDVIDGVGDLDVTLAGSGSEWRKLTHSLVGGGQVSLRDGVLRDVNLVDGALVSLAGLPGLTDALPPETRRKYPRLFASRDTVFNTLDARIGIGDGAMTSDNVVVRAPDFTASGRGAVAFDRTIDTTGVLELSEELSNELTQHAALLQRIATAGRIRIPFRLEGKLPNARPRPDLEQVAHTLQRAAVQEFVDGILDRERKRIKDSAAQPPTTVEQQEPSGPAGAGKQGPEPKSQDARDTRSKERADMQERLKRGLDDLFGR